MPSQQPTLKAAPRDLIGRKVKQLRNTGLLPANVYGKKVKSLSIQVSTPDFLKIFDQAGETGLINLSVKGESHPRPVLVHNLQAHPVTDLPLHVDFRQVDLKEKVTAEVPVELTGEPPAVSQKGGVLIQSLSEIEVEALPTDLPDQFTLDVSGLSEINDALYVKDLQLDRSKVTIDLDPETVIAKIEPPAKEEEEAAPPPPAEGEVATPAAGEAEAAPAEGESAAQEAKSEKPASED
jgi:large subunit ribosomal protein L25